MNKNAYMYKVDDQFIRVLGITLKEGRNFNPAAPGEGTGAVIVNEALVKDYEWTGDAVGTRLEGWDEEHVPGGPVVIGVVKDFNFGSLREAIRPAVLFTNPEWGMDQALIRISPEDIPATMERIRVAWTEIAPDKPYDATFLNEDVQKQYETEQRWMEILRSASVMAIALACMGLFGLAGLSVVNRTKEIGIRKVLGRVGLRDRGDALEGVRDPGRHLERRWPCRRRFSLRRNGSSRTPTGSSWGPRCSWRAASERLRSRSATVALHAVRAARGNPVNALRYE